MRTLVMSTDPAHSLADSLDIELGDAPSEIADRCWATQIDPQARMESNWSEIRDDLREVLDWAGVDDLRAEELAVLPGDDVADPWFDEWRSLQSEQLEAIETGFAPLPVLRAPLAPAEVVGAERLLAFADVLYADLDPAAMLHHDEPFTVHRTEGSAQRSESDSWMMSIGLPFASRDEVDLVRLGDELVVTVGPYRRVMLPDSLRRRPVAAANLAEGTLRVAFGPR